MSVRSKVHKLSGYEAAQSRAAFFVHSNPGYINISGDDRLDFLQRQTTNDIKTLSPGQVLQTVLTSPTARILDVFYVFEDGPDSVCLITLPGYGEKTFNFLKKRVFFRDEVVVNDLSNLFAQLDVEGPVARKALLKIGIENSVEIGRIVDGEFEGNKLQIFSKTSFSQIGYRILIRADHLQPLMDALALAEVVRITDQEYEILRVEAGQPTAKWEYSEDYTPLEVNLQGAISNNKGCYTGQEVIARQVNYDKITKRLVGLHLDGIVPRRAKVYVSDKPVGEVTSLVQSPRFEIIALAVIKRPYYEPGNRVEIRSEQKMINGLVSRLPFIER